MIIRILAFDTAKDELSDLYADRYIRRLQRYCRVELRKLVSKPRHDERMKVLRRHLPANHWMVLLDANGKQYSSQQLVPWLEGHRRNGRSVVFIIGGPYGVSPDVEQLAHERMALSAMTFPHGLVRILLVEQLYRAFTMLHGEPYHH